VAPSKGDVELVAGVLRCSTWRAQQTRGHTGENIRAIRGAARAFTLSATQQPWTKDGTTKDRPVFYWYPKGYLGKWVN